MSTYKFKADMTCEACVNAIRKSLTKTFGSALQSVNADLGTQEVTVMLAAKPDGGGNYSYDEVYQALMKTGRTITKVDG